ncbi:MAG: acyltransferase [Propionibacteriaceae bacterium]|nr:acyltransferase [Propionibacteriaceae bacterium]
MKQDLTSSRSDSTMRVDIQWMRALAVSLVLLYHFWPKRMPGGFVGVDVFFVISGFLITSHLLNKPPRRLGDVAQFWGRRVRRLLPVAFTVIIVTVIAVILVAPMTQWMDNGSSAIWSALYVENWDLANKAVDYLASTNPPTAFQHYWSLSVEEQFYLLWPILLFATWMIIRRTNVSFRRGAGITIGIVVGVSLVYSVHLSTVNPAAAYFVTPTRMWELGAGGFLAVIYPRLQPLLKNLPEWRLISVGLGMGLVVWSGFHISAQGFPGSYAAIPVVGAMLVIGAGPVNHRLSFDTILGWRPIQFLGDISYSVYLWHWPFVVLLPYQLGHSLTWKEKLLAIGVVIGLSALSKTLIEDRFRGTKPLGKPLHRTWIFLVTGMLVTALVGYGAIIYTHVVGKPNQPIIIPADATCVGAAMMLEPECAGQDPHGDTLYMTPLQALKDRSEAYHCQWDASDPQNFRFCEYGSDHQEAPVIALFGNSHATRYLDPLIAMSQTHQWKVRTYTASACHPSLLPLYYPQYPSPAVTQGCLDFTTNSIMDMHDNGVSLVVISSSQGLALADIPYELQDGARLTMNQELVTMLLDGGMTVLIIRDVPYSQYLVPGCLAENLDDLSRCDSLRGTHTAQDPLYEAALEFEDPRVLTLDFTNAICGTTTCYAVIGGVIAYFDSGHMTHTFSMTLAPYLEPIILEALG